MTANLKSEFVFEEMVESLRKAIATFPDTRKGKNTRYDIMDAASGAFSVFFTQCPSFLAHQNLMQKRYGLSNAKTLFGMNRIPSDNQIRNLLDVVSPNFLDQAYEDCLGILKGSNQLDQFRVSLGKYSRDLLIALDGTEYFSSENIQCKNCNTKEHKKGVRTYSHQAITPTIVAPGNSKIISLSPEFITPQDGDQKQDCENKTAKRWLKKHGEDLKLLNTTILGDDLYAHEPFCQQLLTAGLNFILTCKPDSHKTLYEWIKGITQEKVLTRWDGKYHQITTYHWAGDVPLKDGRDTLLVNFVEVEIKRKEDGKRLYKNAFVTNHLLNEETIETIVSCGRARWKIENENNNTLKTQGYHLEHNFGHGKRHLASLLATLNILAFLFHTIVEMINPTYQVLRQAAGARVRLFNDIRTMMQHFCFKSFNNMLEFILQGLKKPHTLEEITIPI